MRIFLILGLLVMLTFSFATTYDSWSNVKAASGSTIVKPKPKPHTHSNVYNYVSAGGGRHYIYVNCKTCGASYSSRESCSYGSWRTTRNPTCTSTRL